MNSKKNTLAISSPSLSPIPVGRSYTTETAEQIEDEVRNVINDLVNFVVSHFIPFTTRNNYFILGVRKPRR